MFITLQTGYNSFYDSALTSSAVVRPQSYSVRLFSERQNGREFSQTFKSASSPRQLFNLVLRLYIKFAVIN